MLNIERQSEIVRFELPVLGETKLFDILYKHTPSFQPLTYELIAGNQEVCAGFIFSSCIILEHLCLVLGMCRTSSRIVI